MSAPSNFPPEFYNELWEQHLKCEFQDRSAADTLITMVDDPYVNHVPVMTGGVGKEGLRRFYAERFIPQMPPDTTLVPLSRTIGGGRLVDEFIFRFTHSIPMDWMLPGVPPTGRPVEIPMLVVVQFEGDKLACERIYWDQASVLVQLGVLDPAGLPVAGVETARKVLDPSLPSNELMDRKGGAQIPTP